MLICYLYISATNGLPYIQSGTFGSYGIGHDGWLEFYIVFPKPYKSPPLVTLHDNSLFSTENLSLRDASATDMHVAIFGPTGDYYYQGMWQAIGYLK